MFNIRIFLLAVAGTILTILSGCDKAPSENDIRKTLERNFDGAPATLDPQRAVDVGAVDISRDLFEGLMTTNRDGDMIRGTAASYEISDDGLTYDFSIRQTAKWSNGEKVTSQDFVRGLQFAANPETLAPQAGLLNVIKNFKQINNGDEPLSSLGVLALDQTRLRIELAYPAPYILSLLEYPITYPRHKESGQETFVSNGPYKFVTQTVGSSVTIEKNPYYWNSKAVGIERVRYTDIPDEMALLSRFRTGDLHITTTVPNRLMAWIIENLPNEYHAVPRLAIYYYAFNLERGPLVDRRVRKALNIVVDRRTLVNNVVRGGQLPAYSFVPPGMPNYESHIGDGFNLDISERVALGQQLMKEAGYTDSNPLQLTLYYNFGENHNRIALFVADQWSKHLPVSVQPLNQEFRVLLSTQQDRSKWDVIRTSWTADYPDPYSFLAIFRAGDPMNIVGYTDEKYDSLLNTSLSERMVAQRMATLKEAEQTLLNEHPGLLLYFYVERNLVSEDVAGYVGNSLGILRTQYLNWTSN